MAESLDLGVGVAESLDLEGLALKELLLLRDCLLPPLGGVSPLRRLLALSFFSSLAACIEQSLKQINSIIWHRTGNSGQNTTSSKKIP